MDIENELQRVLKNPDNVIVSQGLESILAEDNSVRAQDRNLNVVIGESQLVCAISRMTIIDEEVEFGLDVPTLDLLILLKNSKKISISVGDLIFQQVDSTPIVWEDNLLIIKTRRIFNEAI